MVFKTVGAKAKFKETATRLARSPCLLMLLQPEFARRGVLSVRDYDDRSKSGGASASSGFTFG